jgi:hypothetical protein
MFVKKSFRLVSGAPNVLNISSGVIKGLVNEENSPKNIHSFLELKKNSIKHFTKDRIYKLLSNEKEGNLIQAITIEEYPLAVSYNAANEGLIINLKPLDVKEISNLSPNDLYAAIVYDYCLSKLVTGQFPIQETYAKIIVNYLLSFYVQVFGKTYGLVGIYSRNIPKLKYLIACYVLGSYFGYETDSSLFKKAATIAPYDYKADLEQLKTYNFYQIGQFVKAISELKIMPGLNITKFTSTIFRYFNINVLAGIEDFSRFLAVILTSSISGNRIAPRHLYKYNDVEYMKIIEMLRRMF